MNDQLNSRVGGTAALVSRRAKFLTDHRRLGAGSILNAHFQSALKQSGTTATAALQSTFVAACMAPSAISIGM